jgi:hypothetical protein
LILAFTLVCAPLAVRAQPTPPDEPEPGAPPDATPLDQPEGTPPDADGDALSPAPPAVAGATPAPAATNFMDTRLSFTCTHEDMLREPNVLPTAPGFHCGRPNALGVLFFDNYDTRFSGYETLSHLALYKHYDQGHWDVEGGFIVRVNELSEEIIRLADGGSYIRTAYWFDETRKDRSTLSLVAFPVSADRMRLGYSYRISWGGSPEFFKPNPDIPSASGKNPDPVPGAKLQYDSDLGYAYVGIKSSLLRDPRDNEKKSVLGYLAGAGFDVTPMIRVEANGGLFNRGYNELEDVNDERVWLYGGSAQLAIHDGMPVGSSIDYKLYRNEPQSIARLFRREEYPGGLSWLISAEGTMLFQTLKDPSRPSSTRTQRALAGDVNVRVKIDRIRLRADVMMRDLAYILHTTPSLPTYTDFPDEYKSTTEIFAAAGVDQFFPDWGLTAGLTFAIDIPATLETPRPADIPGNLSSATTLVVRNEANFSVLPAGESVAPIWAIKGSARVDFAEAFAALVDVYFQYDSNTVRYERELDDMGMVDPEGSFRPVFANFEQLGFNVTLQTRF